MRHVVYDLRKLNLREGWAADAENVNAEILAEPDPKKRAAIIDGNDNLWREVKHELAKIFGSKCWYTESKQEGTDTDVDHFRPKKRVAEVKNKENPHFGYWWLAFKLNNYRFSCIYANRRRRDVESGEVGGKADHFPLCDEACRAMTPEDDWEEEQPLLLDPCKATDVSLITFKDDGEAMPRYGKEKRPRSFERADVSIELYNINHSDFIKARIELRDDMDELIIDVAKYYKKLETGDATHEHAYESAVKKLIKMRDKNSPYSSFCIAYLEKYRHKEFLDGIFM